MRAEDTLETNCSIQVDVSCWDRTGVPTPSHTFQSNITLSCQHICVLYHHYYFILSVHLYSFLPLSHYLVSKFVFILIIITLSCHLSAHLSSLSLSSLYFVSIISVVKMKHSSELFVQSRFNKRGLQKKHFPPNLLFWTLICLFIFWY